MNLKKILERKELRKEYKNLQDQITDPEPETKEQKTEMTEPEWYWVEGYKGTDSNMQCKGFQYELNKSYTIDGDIEMCRNGFHFCKDLREVFSYYKNGRYFKVRALVSKDEYLKYTDPRKYRDKYAGYDPYGRVFRSVDFNKFVAKTIILIKELPYDKFSSCIDIEFVHNADDYAEFLKTPKDYENNKFISEVEKLHCYSPTFIRVILKEIRNNNLKFEDVLEYMTGLCEMELTSDMNVYLLLDKIKNR